MVVKAPGAFRTISEVSEWLELPAHVLRFWESKFNHIKPVKRAGGRRYYRPNDIALIGGIKQLLHDNGMTILAVQNKLAEEGVEAVSKYSKPFSSKVNPKTQSPNLNDHKDLSKVQPQNDKIFGHEMPHSKGFNSSTDGISSHELTNLTKTLTFIKKSSLADLFSPVEILDIYKRLLNKRNQLASDLYVDN
jgi:DNA-binding transcriptional MerR regulator